MLTKKQKKFIKKIVKKNGLKYNRNKSAEELLELALVLVQSNNKKFKNVDDEIIDEIGDVEIRLYCLKCMFPKKKIKKRIKYKLKTFKRAHDDPKHNGKV